MLCNKRTTIGHALIEPELGDQLDFAAVRASLHSVRRFHTIYPF
jgi:hypothetical protein